MYGLAGPRGARRVAASDGETAARTAPGGDGDAHESSAHGSSAIVHFAPFPLPDFEGNPWSTWSAARFASNGRFYAAIGDHKSEDGNSYLFEYNPATKELRRVADVLSVVPHVAGEYGHGKIHSQINEARDGSLYMTTFRGSARKIAFTNTFRGGVILRFRPGSQ